ncbi:MAG: hypothetical protein AB1634_05310 [Thermodesulfobacteriota bacterium]
MAGSWGLFAVPHGAFGPPLCSRPGLCGDCFRGRGIGLLYAAGGFVLTNSPPAKVSIVLDGRPVDFGASAILTSGTPRFFGVIDTAGFVEAAFAEREGTNGDQKLIFGDGFVFGFQCPPPAGPPPGP